MVGELESGGARFRTLTTYVFGKMTLQILELPWHRYFVGVQFHPEFKSRPRKPSPLFTGLIAAASGQVSGGGSTTQRSPAEMEKRPALMKKKVVAAGGAAVASGGLEDGILVGLHASGAALAH
ncbi:hypothetical protein HU200_066660 [Digitaria exilis]|uniref:CTP synthase (glutamine hydrolyzing) n=1 Tax=Digitaria exilis TaxID=1010633 RepID=A0A834ZXJ4_9POAL|nr:hypothetical protein HU200_066660 [Digitaria exilis]